MAGYLFLSEADPLPGCFADLQIEGSLDCLLLIWKGRVAFCDLCRLMHLPLETSSCTTIELLSKLQLAFFFSLKTVTLVQYVLFPVVEMA